MQERPRLDAPQVSIQPCIPPAEKHARNNNLRERCPESGREKGLGPCGVGENGQRGGMPSLAQVTGPLDRRLESACLQAGDVRLLQCRSFRQG